MYTCTPPVLSQRDCVQLLGAVAAILLAAPLAIPKGGRSRSEGVGTHAVPQGGRPTDHPVVIPQGGLAQDAEAIPQGGLPQDAEAIPQGGLSQDVGAIPPGGLSQDAEAIPQGGLPQDAEASASVALVAVAVCVGELETLLACVRSGSASPRLLFSSREQASDCWQTLWRRVAGGIGIYY